ncbi:MAG: ribosome-associated translation inhibitor RaiA [Spirochaetes bacterium]|nr:ribosome-associated translation inhibitor RaiA [Spirochaetota bacterium]
MTINYNAKNLTITEELKTYFEKRIDRITKYEDLINFIDVYFSIDKYINQVEVVIDFRKGKTVCFTGEDSDMYKAIDDVIDRIEKNVNKYKDKITNHKEAESSKVLELKQKNFVNDFEKFEIVDLNALYKKPLAIDDALFLLDKEKEKNFIVFYNYENLETDDLLVNLAIKKENHYLVYEKRNIANKLVKKVYKKEKNIIKLEEKEEEIKESNILEEIDKIDKNIYSLFIDKDSGKLVFLTKNSEKYNICLI